MTFEAKISPPTEEENNTCKNPLMCPTPPDETKKPRGHCDEATSEGK